MSPQSRKVLDEKEPIVSLFVEPSLIRRTIAGSPLVNVDTCVDITSLAVVATPEPEPAPVAVNTTPTVFADAPIAVKSVDPTVLII